MALKIEIPPPTDENQTFNFAYLSMLFLVVTCQASLGGPRMRWVFVFGLVTHISQLHTPSMFEFLQSRRYRIPFILIGHSFSPIGSRISPWLTCHFIINI